MQNEEFNKEPQQICDFDTTCRVICMAIYVSSDKEKIIKIENGDTIAENNKIDESIEDSNTDSSESEENTPVIENTQKRKRTNKNCKLKKQKKNNDVER